MNSASAILWSICALMLVENPCIAGIRNPPPPDGGKEIASRQLSLVPRFVRKRQASVPLEEMTLSEPHQSYMANADDLAKGQMLSKARLFCWRYLVLHGEKGIAEVQLTAHDKAGSTLQANGVSASGLPNATLAAVKEAEKLPQVKAKDFELRFLAVPSMRFWAVWLHEETEDLIIPIENGVSKGLEVNKAYSEAEVIKVLKPKAEEIIEMFKKAGPRAVGG